MEVLVVVLCPSEPLNYPLIHWTHSEPRLSSRNRLCARYLPRQVVSAPDTAQQLLLDGFTHFLKVCTDVDNNVICCV